MTDSLPSTSARSKECAESCLDFLYIELINTYRRQQSGPATAAAVDAIGFRVGRQLAERHSKDRPRFHEPLDVVKFLCKDFWQEVFKKQVDNLKTNYKGTFVLTDNKFRWLSRLSTEPERRPELQAYLTDYLAFPTGIIRGALSALNIRATVTVESKELPVCIFTIKFEGKN